MSRRLKYGLGPVSLLFLAIATIASVAYTDDAKPGANGFAKPLPDFDWQFAGNNPMPVKARICSQTETYCVGYVATARGLEKAVCRSKDGVCPNALDCGANDTTVFLVGDAPLVDVPGQSTTKKNNEGGKIPIGGGGGGGR